MLLQAGTTEAECQGWFTIASAPHEGTIHISTRVSQSAFKQALNAMRPGDEIQSHSLEGDFTWEEISVVPVVVVAGGIGITPYRSILLSRDVTGEPLNATLLYFNRTDEVPFRRELESLAAKHPEFALKVVVGEQVSADSIRRLAPQSSGQIVFISGPEPMVEAIGSDLKDRGVEVKQDWFPGYDEKSY
ncbi:MAG: FAD-dependent oxidoreductase [Chlorobia bacterium]|nr:FAD-dependent oxidoreductase [Fimbriimonadaceae bacterium]